VIFLWLMFTETCMIFHCEIQMPLCYIVLRIIQGVQLKSGPYFNMSNLFTKIYNMLYYTTNLYLQ